MEPPPLTGNVQQPPRVRNPRQQSHRFFPLDRGIIASGGSQQLLLPSAAELMQIMQDFGRGRAWWFAILHLGEHHIDGVQCLQNDIHQLGSDGSLAIAQDVEHVSAP